MDLEIEMGHMPSQVFLSENFQWRDLQSQALPVRFCEIELDDEEIAYRNSKQRGPLLRSGPCCKVLQHDSAVEFPINTTCNHSLIQSKL